MTVEIVDQSNTCTVSETNQSIVAVEQNTAITIEAGGSIVVSPTIYSLELIENRTEVEIINEISSVIVTLGGGGESFSSNSYFPAGW